MSIDKLSFGGVEEASEKNYTPSGTIDIFTIDEVEFSASEKKGTQFMGVTFKRKQDSITHRFYFSEKALPRIKSLVKAATGEVLEADLGLEQVKAKLKGKQVALKVTARQNEESGKWYADLPFGGFARNIANLGEIVFSEREEEAIASHKRYRELASTSHADGPTAPGAAAATTSEKDDTPF